VVEPQAPLVVLLLAPFDATVESREDDLDRARLDSGLFEERGERGAAPDGRADRFLESRLTDRAR
jgi:hypothetical protein